MARKITERFTLDECEDEIIYTRAALKADPDAADLLPVTEAWLSQVDKARTADRAARMAMGEATALRVVANGRLDDTCAHFGDDLNLAVRKDRASARWRRFFGGPVTNFVRQRLASQVRAVRAWLAITGDEVLEKFRPELDRWSANAQSALDATAESAQARGTAHVVRETLAEDLTRERDGLYAQLFARANERGLGREWPSRFFRQVARNDATESTEPVPQAPSGSASVRS